VAEIVGIIFRGGVKVYHFDPAGLELERGDRVVVQTSSGPEIGQVVEPRRTVDDSELPAPLKKVVRVATDKDLESQAEAEGLRRQAMDTCRELIAEHGLDMKLVNADIGFGGEKITFSFLSEERVDFRALVADLAKALKMRVELRQVGAREETRMIGGLGPCGRGLCCATFPGDDEPVSIRMAKEQNLPLNPMKISGMCGRLMCCLKYEQEQYVRFRKEAPAKGTPVSTPGGEGVVCGYNLTKDAIIVRLEGGPSMEVRLCACQEREGGGLRVIPEVPKAEEPAPVSWLDSPIGIERLAAAERYADALPVVEAEVVLGENGEPIEVVVAEGSRRGRSRRSRGRRRGTGRGQAEGAGAGSGEGRPGGSSAGSGATPGAKEGQRAPQGSDRSQRGDRAPTGQRGERPPSSGGSGGSDQGSPGSSSRPRRRRRSRRPGSGGGGDGASGGGNGGSSGGSSAGAGGGFGGGAGE
jgi:cell fate regulator YaaT (PSP1 superfamily)